jgi:hypothetical protein
MIELMYIISDFQCGSDAPMAIISADIYRNGVLVKENFNKGDKVLLPDMNGVTFTYSLQHGGCEVSSPPTVTLGKNDSIPSMSGAYNQTSLQNHLNGLQSYEELYLVELGTHDTSSSAYDLQDVVFKINSDPNLTDPNNNTQHNNTQLSPD